MFTCSHSFRVSRLCLRSLLPPSFVRRDRSFTMAPSPRVEEAQEQPAVETPAWLDPSTESPGMRSRQTPMASQPRKSLRELRRSQPRLHSSYFVQTTPWASNPLIRLKSHLPRFRKMKKLTQSHPRLQVNPTLPVLSRNHSLMPRSHFQRASYSPRLACPH